MHEFKLDDLLNYEKVTKSTFYYKYKENEKTENYKEITTIYHKNKEIYGYRKLTM